MKVINKETERTRALEQKLKQENDVTLLREEKATKTNETIQKLENELEALKKEAATFASQTVEAHQPASEDQKESLKDNLRELQEQVETVLKASEKELREQQQIHAELKQRLKELEQVKD